MGFPPEFLEGEACIKFRCEQAHEIVDVCDSIGQQRYAGFESWVHEYCSGGWAWAFISNDCVHVGISKRIGMFELIWDDLLNYFTELDFRAADFDALL